MRGPQIGLLTALLTLLASPAELCAQEDFATDGQAWNSVSELIRIAQTREIPLAIPEHLDIGTLEPGDSLLILSPRDELPAAEITAFLHAGGRACLADDFGSGDALGATGFAARLWASRRRVWLLK